MLPTYLYLSNKKKKKTKNTKIQIIFELTKLNVIRSNH